MITFPSCKTRKWSYGPDFGHYDGIHMNLKESRISFILIDKSTIKNRIDKH